MKLVAFAFKGTNSEKVLKQLGLKNIHLLNSSERAINAFIQKLELEMPEYVLGMGKYSGRDDNKLRIETKCNKNFRNFVIQNAHKLNINPFLKPTQHSKYSQGLGNSFCNLVSSQVINSSVLKANYAFIHIPSKFNVDVAVAEIKNMLTSHSSF